MPVRMVTRTDGCDIARRAKISPEIGFADEYTDKEEGISPIDQHFSARGLFGTCLKLSG